MTSDAVKALLLQRPELKVHKAKLEAMQPGAYCIHRSWGFGQIESFDPVEGKLVIHFEGKPSHKMDPAFCVNTLEILPARHVLVRRQTEPEAVATLINENPAQLIHDILSQYPSRSTTAIEIEGVLARLVGPDRFKRWWAAARKVIARDHRIHVPAKKNEVFFIREEEISPEADKLAQFKETRSARRRIALAEELHKAATGNDDVRNSLGDILKEVANAVRDSNQLTTVERLHGAWVRDDLAHILGEDVSAYEPALSTLIQETRQHSEIAEELPAHLQSRLLKLLKDTYADQWREIILGLLKASQGKFTAECINFLVENDCEEELRDVFFRWQTEQNLRAPVLLWIVKNRGSRKYARLLKGMVSPRLLNSIFFAIDYEALQSAGTRRIPLAEYLSDDQELIGDLLADADNEVARDLANQLLLNQGFEELTKKSLLARFIKRFPIVQGLVSGESEEREGALIVSRESYGRRQTELEDIIARKIPENSRAIAAAREHGDLRENSEYKMAKQDQTVLMARKAQLEAELGRAQITDFRDVTTEVVSVGTIVRLEAGDRVLTFTVLGAWDSDPDRNIISYKTALGASLLGKKVGDVVAVKDGSEEREFRIAGIARHADLRN